MDATDVVGVFAHPPDAGYHGVGLHFINGDAVGMVKWDAQPQHPVEFS